MEIRSTQQHVICATTRPARRRRMTIDGPALSRRSTAAGWSSRISNIGIRPQAIVIAPQTQDAATTLKRSGAKTRRSASRSKKSDGTICAVQTASSMPHAPPVTEMRTLSERSCRASWPRLAPSATRTDVSCERAEARASRNDATLAHAMKNTAPAAAPRSVPMRDRPPAMSGVIPVYGRTLIAPAWLPPAFTAASA